MVNTLPLDIAPDPEPIAGAPFGAAVTVIAVLVVVVLILVAVWFIQKKKGGKK